MNGRRREARGGALRWFVAVLALALVGLCVATWASPWPSALAIRWLFEYGGAQANAALEREVPTGIESEYGLHYDTSDPDALLDLHRPPAATTARRPLTTVVWIHGGGFVAGHRGEVTNYARLLAADGYAVASVDYSLAPGTRYPRPVRQVNRALAWLSMNAAQYGLDRTRFVLAGDSAGAQLAAQVALLVSSPQYAVSMNLQPGIARSQLVGTVLFCGPHDAVQMKLGSWFTRTVVWSYFGTRTPDEAAVDGFSVVRHVDARFPPTFISVGDHDPLAQQSYAMADALRAHGVHTDALFFTGADAPGLPHEYQFDLSRPEAREALRRVRAFLRDL